MKGKIQAEHSKFMLNIQGSAWISNNRTKPLMFSQNLRIMQVVDFICTPLFLHQLLILMLFNGYYHMCDIGGGATFLQQFIMASNDDVCMYI